MNIGGTVAVITGGSSGIGRAMVVALAQEGLRAAVIGDLDEAGAQETIRLVQAAGTGTRTAFVRRPARSLPAAGSLNSWHQMSSARSNRVR